jgi:ABC-type transport system involved in multi-copper enzyme maturation permease subunit
MPLLLTLPVSDAHVILAKVLGVLYRSSLLWALLTAHAVVFAALGFLRPDLCLHVLLIILSAFAFLTGTGLYLSSRFRSPTTAGTATVGLAAALWLALPAAMTPLPTAAARRMAQAAGDVSPFVQLAVAIEGASEASHSSGRTAEYTWGRRTRSRGAMAAQLALGAGLHVAVGLLAAWRAKCRLRKVVFADE